jgi:hypothetical protein
MLHPKLDSESGMAMVMALVVTFIGTILASSYMTAVISESRNSVWQKQRAQSFFLAEAGIEKGLYYLNNRYDIDNPWTDDYGEVLDYPPLASGDLAGGRYEISLFDQIDEPWLPANSYLIRSAGIIPRSNGEDIEHRVSCVMVRLDGLPIPAALGVMDDADPEDELLDFDASEWRINGRDRDGLGGVPGIAAANTGDDLVGQLGVGVDLVTGSDEWNNYYQGADAISEDSSLPTDLDAYVDYFRKIAIDVSGAGTLPASFLGTADEFQVLYVNLSEGPIKIAGTDRGFGVLILAGTGEFEMAGGSKWNGVIICADHSHVCLKGGGTGTCIYGSVLLASDSTLEVSGTAALRYSSENVSAVNSQLVLYREYSWCDGWGESL